MEVTTLVKILRLFFGIFLVLGPVFLIIGILNGFQMRRFLATAVSVPGVVMENVYQPSSSDNGSSFDYPRVQFQTVDGHSVSFIGDVASFPSAYRVGEPVQVVYDPKQPDRAHIHSFWGIWGFALLFSALGSVFSVLGGLATVALNRVAARALRSHSGGSTVLPARTSAE